MGMAQLLDDDKYEFTIAASPDEIVPMIVQGQVDVAAVPANLAAVLYQKTDKNISVLAVNTLGVLYLVENGEFYPVCRRSEGQDHICQRKRSHTGICFEFCSGRPMAWIRKRM